MKSKSNDDGKVGLMIRMPKEVHTALKRHCFDQEITMQSYITNLIIADLKLGEIAEIGRKE